jgi:DegV family protein with EDD domain
MEKIGFVSDDTMDFPAEFVERYGIAVAPVKFTWPEIENLPGENTFQKMRELEKRGITSFGKTSQSSAKDFSDRFQEQLAKFEKLICFTLTSKLSGTYNSAMQARNYLSPEDQKRVFIMDSLSVSGGEALVILKAIELANGGKAAEEIVSALDAFVPRCHFSVIVENIKWLEKSGRVSHFAAAVVNGLAKAGIRPVLSMKNGVLAPSGLKTDAKDIPTALFRQFENDAKDLIKQGKKIKAVITHGDDEAGSQRLKEMIEKTFSNAEVVFINIINNVVGVVAGPNSITLSWCEA